MFSETPAEILFLLHRNKKSEELLRATINSDCMLIKKIMEFIALQ